jgi:acyl-CoA thioester hydrolase
MAAGSFSHRVRWGETDTAGIIYYPNYFRWFDEASHELFRLIGFPLADLLQSRHTAALLESGARFRSALRYDDHIIIQSRVSDVRTRSFRVEHEVKRGHEVVCQGFEVRVWVRLDPDGSIVAERIPEDLCRALKEEPSPSS